MTIALIWVMLWHLSLLPLPTVFSIVIHSLLSIQRNLLKQCNQMLLSPCLSHLSVLDLKCDSQPVPWESMRSSIITWQLLRFLPPSSPLSSCPHSSCTSLSCFSATQAPLPVIGSLCSEFSALWFLPCFLHGLSSAKSTSVSTEV